LWQRLGAKISETLDTTTLKDLCDEAREMEPAGKIDHRHIVRV